LNLQGLVSSRISPMFKLRLDWKKYPPIGCLAFTKFLTECQKPVKKNFPFFSS